MFTTPRPRRSAAALLGVATVLGLTLAGVATGSVASADPGTIDSDYAAAIGAGANNLVLASATQPDGDILLGGRLTEFSGVSSDRLVRLHDDGSVDTAFSGNLGTGFNGDVRGIQVQSDGKLVVGGEFTTLDGAAAPGLVRLNADGTVDTAFETALGTGVAGVLDAVALAPDGSIVIGGGFASVNGTADADLARLHPDGSVDTAFAANLGTGFDNDVFALAIQPDGAVLAGGVFVSLNGATDPFLGRVDATGAPDTAFNAHFLTLNAGVLALVLQSDGKILVAGGFNSLIGDSIGRINPDGSKDTTFDAGGGFDGQIHAIDLLTDGSMIVGGDFTANAPIGSHLTKLSSTGAVDAAFTDQLGAGVDDTVWTLAPTSQSRAIAGGGFTTQHVARIGTSSPATQADPGAPALAATGSRDALPLLTLAGALVAAGLLAFALAIRRRGRAG